MICGSGGLTSRLAKAAGAEPALQMKDEKLHTVVARSTFGSEHVLKIEGFELLFDVSDVLLLTDTWIQK